MHVCTCSYVFYIYFLVFMCVAMYVCIIYYVCMYVCLCISYDFVAIFSLQALTDRSFLWERRVCSQAGTELLNWIFRNLIL